MGKTRARGGRAKKARFRIRAALVLAGLALAAAAALLLRPGGGGDPDIFAAAAVVMDARTGRVLYEKNPRAQLMPSSITKLAALLLVFEAIDGGRLDLGAEIEVSARAAAVNASRAGFLAGDVATAHGLIMAAMLPSGSEAVMALGEHLFGTEEAFVEAMNAAAARLGMDGTHFTSSAGLDDPLHVTTARDVALLAGHLVRSYPRILDYSSLESYVYQMPDGRQMHMRNTNDMLARGGVTGLKTGSSGLSGSSIVLTYERGRGTQVYVVLSAPSAAWRRHDAGLLLDMFGGRGRT